MRISRKTGILASSALAGALSLGAVGTAAATVTADTPARPAVRAPSGPASVLGPLSDLGTVGKVVDTLKAAMANRPDRARTDRLISEAKRQLDDISSASATAPGKTTKPGKATKPSKTGKPGKATAPAGSGSVTGQITVPGENGTKGARRAVGVPSALVTQAVNQLKAALDGVSKAVGTNDPTKILDAVNSTAQPIVNLITALLNGGTLPAANLPGLPQLPATTSMSTPAVGASEIPEVPGMPSVPGLS